MDVVKNVHPLLLVVITIISGVYGKRCTFLGPHCNNDEFCCNNNRECCSSTVLAVWVIIVIVIGCVLFISCCVAVICCLVKQSHRPGQVIQPVQQPGVAIVATGHQGQPGTGQPMYGQPMYGHQPYAQQQLGFQQPASGDKEGTSNPAQPPSC